MTTPLETYLPAKTYEEALQRACKLWGVQEEYWDIWGNLHTAELDVRRTVLQSMGVPAGTLESLNSAMEDQARQEWFSLARPTIVATISARRVPVQIAEREAAGSLTVEFLWENGEREQFEFPVASLEDGGVFSMGDQIFVRKLLPLPVDVALGYHRLRVSLDAKAWAESRLIVCPDRAYLPESLENGGKLAGIAVSLYGLRSERNWGCGDFSDLKGFADWAARNAGVDFVALNPLHSIPNRQPYNTSPYLPNCSFYRNPLYLDIEQIEDIRHSRCAQAFLKSSKVQSRLAEFRKSEHVEYEKVYAIKLRFLKLAFREFLKEYRQKGPRAADFKAFLEAEGELLDKYALYSAIDETIHKSNRDIWIWPDWPAEFKDLKSPQIAAFYRAHWRLILFYKYIQWQVDLQLSEAQRFARAQGMAIGLYHDLALATDRCGSDLWAHGPFYISGCRVGSPPDDFAPKGQDWAFPPPNSLTHRQNGYRMFAESIRKNSTHGGALRIDHVMRFFRLFWIPEGKEATDGVYVRDFSEDLLRILALESVRNRMVVIGEDLGTVEPYIRETLAKYGVLSYRLLFFERNKDGSFKLPEDYPEQALVSASTHDLPTLAGFWVGRDIEARRRAGVIGEEQARDALAERAKDKQAMLDAFIAAELLPSGYARRSADIPEFTGELHNAAVGFLAKTPSMLFVLNQEDLFKVDDQQNLPGTTEQYPNWRHKMPYTIEELNGNRQALDYVSMLRSWLDRTGRLRRGSVN